MDSREGQRQHLSKMFEISPNRILYALCALRIPDCIPSEGVTVGRLSRLIEAPPASVERLLRAAEALDLTQVDIEGVTYLRPLGQLLRSDHPHTLCYEFADNDLYAAWTPFVECVKLGIPSYQLKYAAPIFHRIGSDPLAFTAFHAHMRQRAKILYRPLLSWLLRHLGKSVVDVGGGTGGLAELILESNPAVDVTLFDLPETFESMSRELVTGYAGRLTLHAGDLFKQIPAGRDTYVLASVLHDWPDDLAGNILRNCVHAMKPDSQLILLERVLLESGADDKRLGDVWMMAMTGGRERTRGEWGVLAGDAGLSIKECWQGAGELSAIRSSPALSATSH